MNRKTYSELVKKRSKNSPIVKNSVKAFFIGGGFCLIGQGLTELFRAVGAGEDDAKTLCSVSLIALGVILTALHQYEKLAKHGGAGTDHGLCQRDVVARDRVQGGGIYHRTRGEDVRYRGAGTGLWYRRGSAVRDHILFCNTGILIKLKG